MFHRTLLSLLLLSTFSTVSSAVDVILTGGPALKQWEGLRIKPLRHDNWWANFVRASTIRIQQIQTKTPNAKITWIVYKNGYITRGKEDGKPYVQWIQDLAKKYKVKLVWVQSGDAALRAINASPRGKEKISSFFYFGHSNAYAFMLDYGNDIMAVSTQWIHESDLKNIHPHVFAPDANCWSYGCYTGMSMSQWWKQFLHIPLYGNTDSTLYGPVSSGMLPEGKGKWVQ